MTIVRLMLALTLLGVAIPAQAMERDDRRQPSAESAAAAAIFPPVPGRTLEHHELRDAAGRPYQIDISRPETPPPPGGFPVIYVLDGNAWFGVTAEVARLNGVGAPPAVVVGVGYPTPALFDLKRRVFDLTRPAPPGTEDPRLGPLEYGGAPEFMGFIRDRLKPFVRTRAPIDATRQALVGHSLGGLFVLDQLFTDPGAFQAYVAASPSIHFNNAALVARSEAFAKSARSPARLLITVGALEQGERPEDEARIRAFVAAHPDLFPNEKVEDIIAESRKDRDRERMVDNAKEMAARLKGAGLDVSFATFEGEDHLSSAVAAINRGVPFVLKAD